MSFSQFLAAFRPRSETSPLVGTSSPEPLPRAFAPPSPLTFAPSRWNSFVDRAVREPSAWLPSRTGLSLNDMALRGRSRSTRTRCFFRSKRAAGSFMQVAVGLGATGVGLWYEVISEIEKICSVIWVHFRPSHQHLSLSLRRYHISKFISHLNLDA